VPDLKIEKGVPLPSYSLAASIPFDEMEVRDSIFVPCEPGSKAVNVAAARYGRKTGKSFTTRREEGGVRIWRTR
jgi:hypothetical protein